MSLTFNLILNAYSVMILVICVSAIKLTDKRSLQDRFYMLMALITILLLGVDVLGRFDGKSHSLYIVLNHVGNFLLFLLNPVLPSLWLTYVFMQIYDEEKSKRVLYPLLLLNLANVVLLVLSQFNGWYYRIDPDNIYHRGSLFLIPASITGTLLLASFVLTILNRKRLEKREYLSLLLFAIPPFVCFALQFLFYGPSLVLNGVSLSLLIVFLNIQNHSIHTDHLTGANNRRKLDAQLRKRISTGTASKRFAAIMLDLDNFKEINDAYGHDAGDRALVDAVLLLKGCIRSNDFIARYGGDEFVILLDISSQADLELMIGRINTSAAKYNETRLQPYQIKFSIGYSLYDCDSRMGADTFIRQLDAMMYKDKQSKQASRHTDSTSRT